MMHQKSRPMTEAQTQFRVLSLQSWVTSGYVGNSAALFVLQRLKITALGLHTVQFSNHTGHGQWRGRVTDPTEIADLLAGLDAIGASDDLSALLTGYIGNPETGAVILHAVRDLKRRNPALIWCCDPVMGDVGRGFFVNPAIARFFAEQAMGVADLVTPNQFELESLTGMVLRSEADVMAALARLHDRGPRTILLTSLILPDTGQTALYTVVSDRSHGPWRVFRARTPRLDFHPNGAGDMIAASFLAHWLMTGRDPETALARAVAGLYGLLRRSYAVGLRDPDLVQFQDELICPSWPIHMERLS